ncbi:uncharacterized protein LOC101240117 isoform X3 [Hydra vulgaris]|uniref:Uncharacterized protein LOC101240117 isoform X3 n=1 Tax=Hydra vulgaris TaxID=6087 RepID=A0ABM4CKT3_HYDVU
MFKTHVIFFMEFVKNSFDASEEWNFADFSYFSETQIADKNNIKKLNGFITDVNELCANSKEIKELSSSIFTTAEKKIDNSFSGCSTNLISNGNQCSIFNLRQMLKECFLLPFNTSNGENVNQCIEPRCIESPLYFSLNCELHDPVKSCETQYYKVAVKSLVSNLQSSSGNVSWVKDLKLKKYGVFNSIFDFHSYNVQHFRNHKVCDKEVNMDESSPNICNEENICFAKAVCNESNKFKELSKELELKSFYDLHSLIESLTSQVKINSEILLQELTIREQLSRHNELQNTFIATYMNVERKIAEINKSRKKKNRFVFIKYADEQNKNGDISIPYLKNEGGPTSSSLLLMTKVLQGIERDDENVPKLISEYILNIGSEFDLKTELRIINTQ